jgi:hypothetical protein
MNDIAVKKHVLSMLKQHLLGEEGKRFHPKAISVEMMGKPQVEHLADGGEVYDEAPGGWEHKQNEMLGSDQNKELEMEARGGEDFETHTPGWESKSDKTLNPPMGMLRDGYPNTPHGWAKPNEERFADGGYAEGGEVYDEPPHGPKMRSKDFGKTDNANSFNKVDGGWNKDKKNMQGGEFEDEDLEHVEDGGDFNKGHPKHKKMSLKEFLRNKS